MSTNGQKLASVEQYRLENRFDALRAKLLKPNDRLQLSKPLAHWALPSDRGLPLAFMGWSLGELLESSFEALLATPGIGTRKMAALVTLLQRAEKQASGSEGDDASPVEPVASACGMEGEDFELTNVSEAEWEKWRRAVACHGLGEKPLGRFAPSLQSLPTVIWNTPLSYYMDRTLAEIRGMKTHGEKRVRAVLEVFSTAYRVVGHLEEESALALRLAASFVEPIERWIYATLAEPFTASAAEVRSELLIPLVEQCRLDLGDGVAQIARERLGLRGRRQSVRKQARTMALTRARVYQLLEDCSKAMRVRWPEGEWLLAALEAQLAAEDPHGDTVRSVNDARRIFFHHSPEHRRPAIAGVTFQDEPVLAT